MPFPWLAAATVASAIGGSLIQKSAADKATDAAEAAAEANRRAAEEARQQALQLNQPLLDFGYGAIPELTSHLASGNILGGLPGGGSAPAPAPTVQSVLNNPVVGSDAYWDDYGESYTDLQAEWQKIAGRDPRFQSDDDYYEWHYNTYGKNEDRALPTYETAPPPAATTPPPADGSAPPAPTTNTAGAAQVYGPQLNSRPEIQPRPDPGPIPTVNRRPAIARPDILTAPAPTFERPTRTRTELEAPTRAEVPTFTRREVSPFVFDETTFREDPGYRWQLQQGTENILANLAVTGGVESGAAQKGIAKYTQGLADQDWDEERDFAYGVWADNTNRMDRLDESDKSTLYDNYWRGWDADFGVYRYGQDRADRAYEFDVNSDFRDVDQRYGIYKDQRDFASDDYWRQVGRNDALDTFDINRSDSNYWKGAARSDANYDKDTAVEQDIYTIDRDYLTDRWDQKTLDLFRRLGIGQGAAGSITGAGQNYINTVTGANDSAATAKGNSALIGASNTNDLLAQLAKVWGSSGGSGSGGSSADQALIDAMKTGWYKAGG